METVSELNVIRQYPGETAALTAAFLWALSSIVYSLLGRKIPPLQLNFLKGMIAIAFLVITILWQGNRQVDFSLLPVIFLALSGIVGIGLGDTAYFSALNNLGARRTLLMENLSPVMSAFLALVFLGEQLSIKSWCGILLTLLGVAWVISERSPVAIESKQTWRKGIVWGIIAAVTSSIGAVFSRFALVESDISPLFVIPIAAIRGEKITIRRILGVAIALIGIGLLFLN